MKPLPFRSTHGTMKPAPVVAVTQCSTTKREEKPADDQGYGDQEDYPPGIWKTLTIYILNFCAEFWDVIVNNYFSKILLAVSFMGHLDHK